MFGLMRSRSCGLGNDEKLRRRLHYCGTCKSIGSRYGQQARLLLNFDSVFAAEVLTAVAGIDSPSEWDRSIHSLNCFRLPGNDAASEPVRYAAAMTVVLAEVKVADQVADGGGIRWRAIRRQMSKAFQRATSDLRQNWGFPVDELWTIVRRQSDVERDAGSESLDLTPEERMRRFAESTGSATALAFRFGAVAAGRHAAALALETLGRHFGEVVYTIDAIRDVAEDSRAGTFNAVSSAFGVTTDRLPADVRQAAVRVLRTMQTETETAIERLPIAPERAAIFIDRLRSNVDRAVGSRQLHVLKSAPRPDVTTSCAVSRATPGRRVHSAIGIAKIASARQFASCKPLPVRIPEAPFVFSLAAVTAVVAPAAVLAAESPRDIVDALLNVTNIGSVLAMAMPPMGPGADPAAEVRRRAQQNQTGGDTGDSSAECCCDCCDGCCGSNGSEGSCSSCGDGGGCCSGCDDCGNCCHCSNSCCDCDCGSCCDCNCD